MSLHGPEYPSYKPTPADHTVDTVFRCTRQYSAAHILAHMINVGFPVSCYIVVFTSLFVHLPVMLIVYHTNHGNVLIWGLSSKGASCSLFPADLGRSVFPRFLPSKLVFMFNSLAKSKTDFDVALQCLLLLHRVVAVRNQCEAYRYYTCLHSTFSK